MVLMLLGGTAQADLRGMARVIDGDTLEIAGTTVRLHGIDAPEADQTCDGDGRPWPCGEWAGDELRRMIGGDTVECARIDTDRYGRTVARCTVGRHDLGGVLVEAGAAFAYRRYSLDYVAQERAAQSARRGLWDHGGAGTAQPALWRGTVRHVAAQPEPGNCAIKGNVSANGRIYHLPGQRDYERTRINVERGERWFCSEAEAQAAGWRPAQR